MSSVSVSSSEQCADCDLKVENGLSTAVVNLKLDGTRLTITPSIPMEFTFNSKKVSVNTLSLYSPCPIRIENVQYDAVITLNGNNGTFLLMIPIQASSTPDQASDSFLSRVVSRIPDLLPKALPPDPKNPSAPKATSPESASVPTGSDWILTSILPLTGDAEGKLTSQNPFFYWGVPYPGMDDLIERIDWLNMYRRWTGQPPIPYPYANDPRMKAILMAKPATAGANVMSYIHLLPKTPVPTNTVPSKGVLYKAFICGESKGKKEKFTNEECNPFSLPPTPPPFDAEILFKLVLPALAAIAGFVGIYFAVKYAAGPTGDIVRKIGESIGKGLLGIKKSLPSVPEPYMDEKAEKRLSSSLNENPFFKNPKQDSPEIKAQKEKNRKTLELNRTRQLTPAQTEQVIAAEPTQPAAAPTTPEEQAAAAGTGLTPTQTEQVIAAKPTQPVPADLKYRKLTSRPAKVIGQSPSKTRRAQVKPFQRKTATLTQPAAAPTTPEEQAAPAGTELTPAQTEQVIAAEPTQPAPEGAKKRLIAMESESDLTPAMVKQAEEEHPELKFGGPLPGTRSAPIGYENKNPTQTIADRRASRQANQPKPGQRATTARRVPQ